MFRWVGWGGIGEVWRWHHGGIELNLCAVVDFLARLLLRSMKETFTIRRCRKLRYLKSSGNFKCMFCIHPWISYFKRVFIVFTSLSSAEGRSRTWCPLPEDKVPVVGDVIAFQPHGRINQWLFRKYFGGELKCCCCARFGQFRSFTDEAKYCVEALKRICCWRPRVVQQAHVLPEFFSSTTGNKVRSNWVQ